ncbi:hypothetical protein A9G06_16940 [Aeromonas sp. DNP9]|nr:hypothetical protein A9G06_16940 [Aeromonas sp. DNP9]
MGNKKVGWDVRSNSDLLRLIGDFLVIIEPAGGKIRRMLKKTNVLRAMRNDKSQANKKPTQHDCMGSV